MNTNTMEVEPSAYTCMLLIFCQMVLSGKPIIDRTKIVSWLWKCREDPELRPMFVDICFQNHWDYLDSQDINDVILKLYTYGGIIHPSMSDTLILNFSKEQAEEILNGEDVSSEWRRMVCSIVDKYPD